MLVVIENREDTDQTSYSEAVTVCLCLFARQLVFKILEVRFSLQGNFLTGAKLVWRGRIFMHNGLIPTKISIILCTEMVSMQQ